MQLLTVNRLTDSYILAVTGYGMPASFTALLSDYTCEISTD